MVAMHHGNDVTTLNPVEMLHGAAVTTHFTPVAEQRSVATVHGSLESGGMSACNDENTTRHAPLQQNKEAGLFCKIAEWKIMHLVCMAMCHCKEAFVHCCMEIGRFMHAIGTYGGGDWECKLNSVRVGIACMQLGSNTKR
jgi:hypothetical protein